MAKPMTIKDAAAYTGYSVRSLYYMVAHRKIPCYKPEGQKLFFSQQDLDAFIYRNRQAADYEVAEAADGLLNGERTLAEWKRFYQEDKGLGKGR